jgi:hypothetical protein
MYASLLTLTRISFSFLLISILFFVSSCQKISADKDSKIILNDSIQQEDTMLEDTFYYDDFEEEAIKPITENEAGISLTPIGNYSTIKTTIKSDRNWFKQQYEQAENDSVKNEIIDSAEKYIFYALLNKILPHWYGTEWDFEGHTNTPNEGYIACGYYVSTTLNHVGYNLNRYRLAQQHSLIAIKTVELADTFINFGCGDAYCLEESIQKNLPDGLYMIGLDCHVGYILKNHGKVFFLHSSYMDPLEVVIERFRESSPLTSSTIFLMGRILPNKELTKKWILDEEIEVFMD